MSYQSRRSPYYGEIPIALIIGQWGFECSNENGSWRLDEFAARYNPGNQGATCGYCGSTGGSGSTGKDTSFCDLPDGVTAYAHLLISGYKHVAYGFGIEGWGNPGLERAIDNLVNGYDSDYDKGSTSYCISNTLDLNSYAERRIWATAGYSGLYSTLTSSNNTCLNNLVYVFIQWIKSFLLY